MQRHVARLLVKTGGRIRGLEALTRSLDQQMTPESDAHYTLSLIDHQTGRRLKIELVDLPFPCRRYRLRINGQWAKKLPEATKSEVHPVR